MVISASRAIFESGATDRYLVPVKPDVWLKIIKMLLHQPQTTELARLFSQRSPAWSLQPLRRPCRLLTGRKQLQRLFHLKRLAAPSRQQPVMFPGPLDVDQELWGVLDMASDEELEALHRILYGEASTTPDQKPLT